jgi:hypothetical protein
MSIELPPKPDRQTGEPRPPEAPVEAWAKPEKRQAPESAGVAAPGGMGPVLEGHRESLWGGVLTGATVSLVVAVLGSLVWQDISWVSTWWMWIIVLIWIPVFAFGRRGATLAAGADWLRQNDRWVKTYELTKIKLGKRAGGYSLELADRDGHVFSADLYELQRKPRLWDLVYNGLLHSAARNRPDLNRLAIDMLALPNV